MDMILEYLHKAVASAQREKMEDGRYFATISGFTELWAEGGTRKECLAELRSTLEEWLIIALRNDEDLPDFEGLSLNFAGNRWQSPLPAES